MSEQERKASNALPPAKSYTLDGDTAEFNPFTRQVHELSPELRREISGLARPRLNSEPAFGAASDATRAETSGGASAPSARARGFLGWWRAPWHWRQLRVRVLIALWVLPLAIIAYVLLLRPPAHEGHVKGAVEPRREAAERPSAAAEAKERVTIRAAASSARREEPVTAASSARRGEPVTAASSASAARSGRPSRNAESASAAPNGAQASATRAGRAPESAALSRNGATARDTQRASPQAASSASAAVPARDYPFGERLAPPD